MRMTQEEVYKYNARRKASNSAIPKLEVESKSIEREKYLHDSIIVECRRMGWAFVHSRMDRATTQAKGVPDFIIALPEGRTLWIECKSKIGKQSSEQQAFAYHIESLGHEYYEVRDFGDFLGVVQ